MDCTAAACLTLAVRSYHSQRKKQKAKKKKRTNVVGALEHFGRRAQVCSAVQTLRYTAHHTVYIPRPLTYFKFRFRARLGIHGVRVRVRT